MGEPAECQPLLRWAGSKRRQIKALRAESPATFRRYIEPFAGSACFFLALSPKRSILGDVNGELIEFYRTLRKAPREVHRLACQFPEGERSYYSIRETDPTLLDPALRAARFVYLNRHCFNGVFRTNRSGAFNVPFGSRTGRLPSLESFELCASRLKRAKLLRADFEVTLQSAGERDFVYVDPPFFRTGRRAHGEYGYGIFGDADHARLEASLLGASSRGARILVSASRSLAAALSLPGWHKREIRILRNVAGFAGARKQGVEVMLRNYER